MKTFILVPVYNEGSVLRHFLPRLLEVAREIGARVVIIDDSSSPPLQKSQLITSDSSSLSFWQQKEAKTAGGKTTCLRVAASARQAVACPVPYIDRETSFPPRPPSSNISTDSTDTCENSEYMGFERSKDKMTRHNVHQKRDALQRVLQSKNLIILRHEVNCGVGAALGTGLAYAKKNGAECVLTIDGDGQHKAEDLLSLYRVLRDEKGALLVNGSRFLKQQHIPLMRRWANLFGNVVTFLLSGYWVTDSQSGMKGFSRKVLDDLEIPSAGYEWSTDVFREANWHHWKIKELPISVSYNSYTLNKGQHLALGLDMLMKLVVRSLMRGSSE